MLLERKNFGSDAPWENDIGYSRAVRIGSLIAVAGTAALGPYGRLGSSEEAYRQAHSCLERIQDALEQAGAQLSDVIRTRIYVVHIQRDWQAVGRAHAEFFRDTRPVTSMVEVSRLIDKQMLVEIEADAVVAPVEPDGSTSR